MALIEMSKLNRKANFILFSNFYLKGAWWGRGARGVFQCLRNCHSVWNNLTHCMYISSFIFCSYKTFQIRRAQLRNLLYTEQALYEMELNNQGKTFFIQRTWHQLITRCIIQLTFYCQCCLNSTLFNCWNLIKCVN